VNCVEAAEQAAAFALGALDPPEAAELERHLAEPGPHACHAALARAGVTVLALAGTLPAARPAPEVWEAVALRTGAAEPRRRPVVWGAVVIAAVALAAVGLEALHARRLAAEAGAARADAAAAVADRDRLRAALAANQAAGAPAQAALTLLDAPGTRLVPLEPQPGQAGRAVAVVSAAADRAVVVSASLPAPAGKVYQLWVIRGATAPVPAGFLTVSGPTSGGELAREALAGPPPDALAVSLEPPGGSPSPTQVVLVGKLRT
jgi:anti-sigma-K factor RskA